MYIHLIRCPNISTRTDLTTVAYTLIGMDSETRERKGRPKLVRLPCACANLRRTARLVTQLYEDAIRPAGVTGPQFTLLQALKQAPGITQKRLAEVLGMDSTTLTRSLAHLHKHGWLSSEPGEDRRVLRLSLTTSGEKAYARILPYWESAQKSLREAVGNQDLAKMVDAVVHAAEMIGKSNP